MLLCAITSCIVPNTDLQVSSLSTSSRLNSAIENIAFLVSLKQFDHIIFADPSLFSRPKVLQVFQAKLSASQINLSNLICLYPQFNPSDLKLIENKGKGLSELLLLTAIVNHINLLGIDNAKVIKVSARYQIVNMNSICAFVKSRDLDFAFEPYASLSYVNTVCFAFRIKPFSNTIDSLTTLVDDKNFQYIERVFFNLIYLNAFFSCIRLPVLVYALNTQSGSHNFQYGFFAQLKRFVLSLL